MHTLMVMQPRAAATVHARWSALLPSLHGGGCMAEVISGGYMMEVALMMPWKPAGMPLT